MANLTADDLEDLMLDDLQANVAYKISCTTAGTTTITSAALFGSVTVGMKVSGTGILAGTTVTAIATTSSLTISQAATDSTTATRAFAADPPITLGPLGKTYDLLNDAYATIFELWGGTIIAAPSSDLWVPAVSTDTTGKAFGALATVSEIVHLYGSTTAPFALTTVTAGSTLLTSAALFANVKPGMAISGTGIASGTRVAVVTDTSNLTMTIAATDSTSNSRTFSPTEGTELDRVELSQIEFLRSNSTGLGTYIVPKVYALSTVNTTTAANVNKLLLDYWPGISGYYFPAHYIPMFTPMSATTDVPDVPDLAQRDIAHLAALNACPLIGRSEFEGAIQFKISEKTRLLLERKQSAMVHARQDK